MSTPRKNKKPSVFLMEKAKSRKKRAREKRAAGLPTDAGTVSDPRSLKGRSKRQITRELTRRMMRGFEDHGVGALMEILDDRKKAQKAGEKSYLSLNVMLPPIEASPALKRRTGIEFIEIQVQVFKDPKIAAKVGPVWTGGSMVVRDSATAWPSSTGISFSVHDGPTTIRSRVVIDPDVIRNRSDLTRYFNEIHSELQKNIEHELWHSIQLSRGVNLEKYSQVDDTGKIKIDSEGRPYPPPPEGTDPNKVMWQTQDPVLYPRRSRGGRYLLSAHETESQVRGFYKQSVKSRGKFTFEELVDERIEAGWADDEPLTLSEKHKIKEQYMAYADTYLPCAKLLSGRAMSPKRCRGQKKIARRFFSEMRGKIDVDPRRYRPGWGYRIFGAVMLTFLWAEIARAVEMAESAGIDPKDASMWPRYAAILVDHGISIVDPTFGAWEVIKGLYKITAAEDPELASRRAGKIFQQALFLRGPEETATRTERCLSHYEPNPQYMGPPMPVYVDCPPGASQKPHPMLPVHTKKDPREPAEGQEPPTTSRPNYVLTTKKPVLVPRTDLQRDAHAPAVAPMHRYPQALRGAVVHSSRVIYVDGAPVLRPEDWAKDPGVHTTALKKKRSFQGAPAPVGLFEGCRKQRKMVIKIKKK